MQICVVMEEIKKNLCIAFGGSKAGDISKTFLDSKSWENFIKVTVDDGWVQGEHTQSDGLCYVN